MISLGKLRTLPSALAIFVLASTVQGASINFDFYPETAQGCMYAAADASKCETGVVKTTNECLCQNGGGFIKNTASCLGQSSRDDLQQVYDTMSGACRDSRTPMGISEKQFMDFADGATTTSTSITTTTAPTSTTTTSSTTSTPTSTESPPASTEPADEGSQGLPTAALAGIIAGSVVGVAAVAGVVFFLLRKKRKQGEESHPMLPDSYTQPPLSQTAHMSVTPSASGTSGGYVSPPDTGVWPPQDQPKWMPSPEPAKAAYNRASGYNWESPEHLSLPPDTQAQAQAQAHDRYTAFQPFQPHMSTVQPPIHELDVPVGHPAAGGGGPVEMSGTPIQSPGPRWTGQP
ncbi:hypothetical protein QC763_609190 [Podospora pseudopauciseta]|uniref:Extracellular membrane protein CFEM domain-containing protein n=2 Tax=Podospora TaxID=5144 RepID=A0ABR0H6B1_9PEZI|nr:hypothetical protein QC763_609190 [Podospora pseudopauciseta]KAK4671840.1 hypothetical protein QC764_609190 [Podospora pseudoanserina]